MTAMPAPSFKTKLYRALELLGDTLNTERSLLGPFSPEAAKPWALAEQEQTINLKSIVTLEGGAYVPNIPLHPDVWMELQKMFPQLDTGAPLVDDKGRDLRFNSNILPKVGSAINESILELALLYGARVNNAGEYNRAQSSIPDDVIIATMIYKTMGKPLKSSPLYMGKDRRVTDDEIVAHFGQDVLDHVHGLQDAIGIFDKATHRKDGTIDSVKLKDIDPAYASSVLAIKSAELKEAIRIDGFREFEVIGHHTGADRGIIMKELRTKLSVMGLDPKDLGLAQNQLLVRKLKEAEAALSLENIAPDVQKLVQERQVAVVKKVLAGEEGWTAERMVGFEGEHDDLNGQALAMFHRNLPIMGFEVPGHENDDATLVKALLEASRYHHNGFRKGNNSIIGHLVQTASTGSHDLGETLRTIVATTLILHDLAEDGGAEVAGLDQSLRMISERFSPLIAELVADLTDAADKKASHAQGKEKAAQTKALEHFIFADSDPRWTQPTRPLIRTNPDRPYALTSAGPKIGDRRATMKEMLQDPDYMSGYSAHSGWRIGWRMNTKGFVDDLNQHIADQLYTFDRDPDTFYLPIARNPDEQQMFMKGLRVSLMDEFKTDDLFMVQNLAILADEFGLSKSEREKLIGDFTNPTMTWENFSRDLDTRLPELAIKAQIQAGRVPGLDHSVMYRPNKTRGNPPTRTHEGLKAYREAFMHRLEMRKNIDGLPLDCVAGREVTHMLAHYDERKGVSREDAVQAAAVLRRQAL